MQSTRKSTDTKTKMKIQLSKEEDITKREEKKKIALTPRNFLQKASTTDIYGQKNVTPRAPKKQGTTKPSNASPMSNILKSSASSISQISKASTTSYSEKKTLPYSTRKKEDPKKTQRAKELPISNVTVNSPSTKKKLDLSGNVSDVKIKRERDGIKIKKSETSGKGGDRKNVERDGTKIRKKLEISDKDGDTGRQRTKTRTLHEDEVKVLTPDVVDNNAEMVKLSQKLTAKPKAFYVDLDDGQAKDKTDKVSDEEISYEDDFESYESDFESYHSSHTEHSSNDDVYEDNGQGLGVSVKSIDDDDQNQNSKDNEEKMLDSGNFELREAQRSASHSKPTLDFIQEDKEGDVKVSLTDEGFQEMSTSSTASSMKTVHIDVLDRPLFVDFSKAKANKRKRKIFENLKQRAKDILSMVTFHEMSYVLFEMKPIPYDLFMATFGRSNFMQIGVQTFEDGVSEEIQTDEIECDEKWTQHPIEFSNHVIYLKDDVKTRKPSNKSDDYLSKFTFLTNNKSDDVINDINTDSNYNDNPLRIYFEQKDGAGNCEMLPYETYKSKLRNNDFSVKKLSKFLKKVESRFSRVLSLNNSDQDITDAIRSSKYPFSKGYVSLNNKDVTDEKLAFVKHAKITNVVFSDSKSNLIMTVHKKSPSFMDRCVICLWDLSVARREPVKVLIAIDDVAIGRFRGNTDGIFAAALEDGSIHLWDLSEEATWRNDACEIKDKDLKEVSTNTPLTETERDREWNLQNSNVGGDMPPIQPALQSSSFTSSAVAVTGAPTAGSVVGMEWGWHARAERGLARKVVGQVCSLQNIGILSIWSIIQDKVNTSTDMGKAYWSKMKLEITQRISLIDHLSIPKSEPFTIELNSNFNLNAAKRRTSLRRKEKIPIKKVSRPKSAVSFDSDRSERPNSAASRRMLPTENNWETGIVCNDFKIMNYENSYSYLVAKNCGEVLSCSRTAGAFKVSKLTVSTEMSSVTSLAVSSDGLPYFLAATDSGTINLCSVVPCRVLLTLDCRNRPQHQQEVEKFHAHEKGHFVGSVTVKKTITEDISIGPKLSVNAVLWSSVNPCSVFASMKDGSLVVWELTHSDIYARCVIDNAAIAVATTNDILAIVNPEGEVQIHRVGSQRQRDKYRELFSKYAALL